MSSAEGNAGELGRLKECITEFMKGAAEMSVELGKGCRDIVKQNLLNEDSYVARKFGRNSYFAKRIRGPCEKLCGKLSFFNEYLPEDKDPLHAWSVIFFVSFIAFAGEVECSLFLILIFPLGFEDVESSMGKIEDVSRHLVSK